MPTAAAQETSKRTFSRTLADTWAATRRVSVLTAINLYPGNLLFIEKLSTIPVFCSIPTHTPYWGNIRLTSTQGHTALRKRPSMCERQPVSIQQVTLVRHGRLHSPQR